MTTTTNQQQHRRSPPQLRLIKPARSLSGCGEACSSHGCDQSTGCPAHIHTYSAGLSEQAAEQQHDTAQPFNGGALLARLLGLYFAVLALVPFVAWAAWQWLKR